MAKKLNPYAITGNITRTFFECEVTAFKVVGIDGNGMPKCESVTSDVYVTVNPNDKAQIKRIVREIGGIVETAQVTILAENVYTMALNDFYYNADVVVK